jgi:tartrate-resistant acid phosphatase type 5
MKWEISFPLAVVFLIFYSFETRSQVFACIGDYGDPGLPEYNVSELVKSWHPEFIITAGDNNYPIGDSLSIDTSIGYYYHQYIFPYSGKYLDSTDTTSINRFFPSLGNHDLLTDTGKPYYNYFMLPNNERYYDFVWGNVHFFALNSDTVAGHEPDGASDSSIQAGWLMSKLAASVSPWKIVYFHHAAYSSGGAHGSSAWMQWPFAQWGASAVIGGHDHIYERLDVENIPYFVNGLGGRQFIYSLNAPLPESQKQYNGNYGAMRISAFADSIVFEFRNINDSLVDAYTMYNTVSSGNEISGNEASSAIFPNPLTNSATVLPGCGLNEATLVIYDAGGKEMDTQILQGKTFKINGKSLAPGLYFYKIMQDKKIYSSGKFIKEG